MIRPQARLRLGLLSATLLLFACDGGRDRLIAQLQSPRAEERSEAVQKLAQESRPEDLVLFTRAAKDASALVRGEAATALGRSQDPRVVDLLGELLGDSDEAVQAQAAHALAAVKNDKAKAYLTLQYGRRGRSTRQAIVEALKAANVPGAMASVVAAEAKSIWDRNLSALMQGELPERVAAAEELGKSGRAEAVSRLSALLKDSQVVLVAAAVRGLGHAGDRRVVPALVGMLRENFPELREAATESLHRLGDPLALARLREVAVEGSSVSPLATAAVLAFPRSADTDAALCEIALRAAGEQALVAGREMRARGGCPLEPLSEALARGRAPESALHALAALGPTAKALVPKVLPLLAEPKLQRLAVDALGELGDPSAVEPLRKLHDARRAELDRARADWIKAPLPQSFAKGFDPASAVAADDPGDPDAQARIQHADLFKKVQELNAQRIRAAGKVPNQVREPVELVEDGDESSVLTVAATLRALGRLGAADAKPLLEQAVKDPNPKLRTAGWVGLASLGGPSLSRAAEGLVELDRDVNAAIAAALVERGADGQKVLLSALETKAGDRLPLLLALTRAKPVPEAAPVLVKTVQEGGAEAAVAAQLLGELGDKQGVDALVEVLKDATSVARREALIALGKLGDARAVEAVSRDLYHDSPDIRAAAAEALAHLKAPAAAEALDALKGDYYRRVRENAERALAPAGEPSAPAPTR